MNAGLQVSSAKAERELGWRHRPLHETLREEVAWYRSQGMIKEPTAVRNAREAGAMGRAA